MASLALLAVYPAQEQAWGCLPAATLQPVKESWGDCRLPSADQLRGLGTCLVSVPAQAQAPL